MNPEYKDLHGKADELWHQFQDRLDDKRAGEGLLEQIRNIREYCEMNKNPRDIEELLKRIIEELTSLRRGNGGVMEYGRMDEFIHEFEDMRQEVRRLPNY